MLQKLHEQVRAIFQGGDPVDFLENSGGRWRALLRFSIRVVQNFIRNQCPLWASALTYSSLLAFIPMLAVVIGISTSLLKNDAERIKGWIDDVLDNVVPQLMRSAEFADTKDKVMDYVIQAINNVNSGAIGTTGIIALLVMILFMLTRIEESMNRIWGVTQGRSWYKRMVNYWAAITLGPILIVAAIGFSTSLRLGKARADSPTLTTEDLVDAEGLAARLDRPETSLERYLRGRSSRETRQALSTASWEDPLSPPERAMLVNDLNNVIEGDLIYDTNRFEGVRLRPETKKLLTQEASAETRPRANRLLLEDAFPGKLAHADKTWLERLPIVGSLLIRLIPIPILSLACALFYGLMPNTRVQWDAALVGGSVAGILWYLNNSLSVLFVTQATRSRAIYNSLAAVPVFMVGMYFFWLLLLFGAQVACTYQNRRCYLASLRVSRIHQAGREQVAMRIMVEASRAFASGQPPPSLSILAEHLDVPESLVTETAGMLLRNHLLVETDNGEPGFVPARPLQAIRVADVLEVMRRGSGNGAPSRPDGVRQTIERELERVAAAEQKAGARTLAELLPVDAGAEGTASAVPAPES